MKGRPMRRTAEAVVEKAFPGMGWRPLWLSVLATWALVAYLNFGRLADAPAWFIEAGSALTGIEAPLFHQHGWAHLSAVVLLLLVPLTVCRLAEGWGLRELGFRLRGAGPELRLVVALWLAFVPVIWLVSGTEGFARMYPRFPPAETDARLFFLYEGFYLVKWISWEFFFRGFMLFGFRRDFGARAVLLSTIPYTLVHWGKPELEMFSALLGGLVLCFIALRSRSIWPGVFLHFMVAATMDFFASTWWMP